MEVSGPFGERQPRGGVVLLLALDVMDEDGVVRGRWSLGPPWTGHWLERPLLRLEDLMLLGEGVPQPFRGGGHGEGGHEACHRWGGRRGGFRCDGCG